MSSSRSADGSSVLLYVDRSGNDHELFDILSGAGLLVARCDEPSGLQVGVRNAQAGCIVADLAGEAGSAVDLLARLRSGGCTVPIIIVMERADIPTAVRALRHGAADVFKKPVAPEDLVRAVVGVLGVRRPYVNKMQFRGRPRLTHREGEVLSHLTSGKNTKEIARILGLSARTVETYRSNLIRNLAVRNTTELVRLVISREVLQPLFQR
ncbi:MULTISPECIES: LuxR C-terminal-related transcriptional regulator [unclassified Bradyrhizobium]|uniref:response regulator transcription factor n=1 Tax=unclassified Bradyrhizobium TaxID=2631580 RepID=UPI002478ED6A|nr:MULTISPECIES: LuxR C-terminal-related transcriptional regulator [unclassified Bradyrhizobium]WGR73110.1 LuxR C-terminal-related transcriptional regulator [Bradyrhizobium sp. ISRA426]WGR77950.1 LuxR C-terminal-related transcriptional regulator [Bradyrhizobium sp. ISRA430]WGR88351.1 LuxR C-terminal-related transcriptional regulator [Bradyrhizobium sp. ISRA432]